MRKKDNERKTKKEQKKVENKQLNIKKNAES